jgi:hypothetical protein
LISLDPHSFERMEEYLTCVKDIQLKLGECGKKYYKNDGKLIELVLMNLRTPFNMFISNFHTNYQECNIDGKDYTIEDLCCILITGQYILLEQGNIGGQH